MSVFHRTRVVFCMGLLGMLAACSSSGTSPVMDSIRTVRASLSDRDPTARDARAVLTPQIVAVVEQPYMLVELPARQASATRFLFREDGPLQDWRGEDGISLVLVRDALVGTRGLGADLFAADPVPAMALQNPDGAAYPRSYRHLDGENREVVSMYRCRLERSGNETVDLIARQVPSARITETCARTDAAGSDILNDYWVGLEDSVVWKSRQWVSEGAAYATISYLVR